MSKRAFDLIGSSLSLVMLSIVLLVVAVLVKLDSPGPVFYRARRVGRYGKCFDMYKFRTMVTGPANNGPRITRQGDPRVTKIGRFLRKTKLDELPQFANVLKGDMSLVGPRPEDPRYAAWYTPEQRRVLSVRPGIASPATIEYRDEEQILTAVGGDVEAAYVQFVLPDKLRRDLEYVEHQSFLTDLAVTIQLVLCLLNHGRRSHRTAGSGIETRQPSIGRRLGAFFAGWRAGPSIGALSQRGVAHVGRRDYSMQLGQIVELLWRRLGLIMLGCVVVGVVAFMVSRRLEPVYETSSVVLVNPTSEARSTSDLDNLAAGQSLARTYSQVMMSHPVLDQVIANLGLATNSETLSRAVSAVPIEMTQLVRVTAQDRDPQRAADIANEIVRVFRVEDKAYQSAGYELLVVEPALPSTSPVSPKVWLNVLLSVGLWTLLVIGWLIARYNLADAAKIRREGVADERNDALALDTIVTTAVSSACSHCVYRVGTPAQQADGNGACAPGITLDESLQPLGSGRPR